jgi:hypothetical protein
VITKKSQATLPFFGLQLASIILFLIVVISLMTMQRNLVMFTTEFDEKSENYLQTRRMLSTTDCFAYEEKDLYYYNGSGSGFMLGGKRIYPFTIDINKITDTRHVNCMRKDFFDSVADASDGILDLGLGTGASAIYEISVMDLSTDIQLNSTSDVGTLAKTIRQCFWTAECWKYGYNYECTAFSQLISGTWCDNGIWCMVAAPLTLPVATLSSIFGAGGGSCIAKSTGGDPDTTLSPRAKQIVYTPIEYDLTARRGDAAYNCTNKTSVRSVFPILIKNTTGTGVIPGVMYITTCNIKAENYKGIPFCQRNFRTGMEECNDTK